VCRTFSITLLFSAVFFLLANTMLDNLR